MQFPMIVRMHTGKPTSILSIYVYIYDRIEYYSRTIYTSIWFTMFEWNILQHMGQRQHVRLLDINCKDCNAGINWSANKIKKSNVKKVLDLILSWHLTKNAIRQYERGTFEHD